MKSKPFKFGWIFISILAIAIALSFNLDRVVGKGDRPSTDKIKFKGKMVADKDISAIGFVGKYLVVGGDEGSEIQVLEPNKKRTKYRVAINIKLLEKKAELEVDIEGIAVVNNTVYVTGSHSTNNKNKLDKTRSSVFRFQLNPDTGKLESKIEKASLRTILLQDEVLSQFANLTYSENGVNIEGIAVKGDRLYFGFRTPVLENNYVPIVVTKFEDLDRIDRYNLQYINLGGGGVRDLVAVNNGFLILTDGNDDDNDYKLYFWDSKNELSKQNMASTVEFLDNIPVKKNTRAEGLTILQETNISYRILVVYDGVAEGNPTIFEIEK